MLAAMAECEKVCKYIDLPLQHASDAGAQAHEAARHAARLRAAARSDPRRASPASPSAPPSSSAFPGETEADSPSLRRSSSDHAFDHVGVFTYSHEEGTSAHRLDDDVPARSRSARRIARDATAEADGAASASGRASASGSGCWWTARRPSTTWSCGAGWKSQAPDIDPSVYLTDCDPSSFRAGDFVEVEIVAAARLRSSFAPADRVL